MLELCRNFFTSFCDVNKFEELETDADSLYSALAEEELEDCIRLERKAEWQTLRSNDCVDIFTADTVANFFPRTCCVKHKQHDERERGLFKEQFRRTEMLCLCSKTDGCNDVSSNKLKFISKGRNKRVLEPSGDGPLKKYRRVLNEKARVTLNNRGFRTYNHSVATYEQVKKSLSYFNPIEWTRLMEFTLNRPIFKIFFHSFFILYCHVFVQLYTFQLMFLTSIESFYIDQSQKVWRPARAQDRSNPTRKSWRKIIQLCKKYAAAE